MKERGSRIVFLKNDRFLDFYVPCKFRQRRNLQSQLTISGDFLRLPDVKQYAYSSWPKKMISKCANPTCSKLLMRLDGGRFFGFHTSQTSIEHFWLCLDCSKHFTLKHQQGKVELVQRPKKTA